jgi:hypothetical protein
LRNFLSLILFGQCIKTVLCACSRLSFCTSENLFLGILSSEPEMRQNIFYHIHIYTHVKFKTYFDKVRKDFYIRLIIFFLLFLLKVKLCYFQCSLHYSPVTFIKTIPLHLFWFTVLDEQCWKQSSTKSQKPK